MANPVLSHLSRAVERIVTYGIALEWHESSITLHANQPEPTQGTDFLSRLMLTRRQRFFQPDEIDVNLRGFFYCHSVLTIPSDAQRNRNVADADTASRNPSASPPRHFATDHFAGLYSSPMTAPARVTSSSPPMSQFTSNDGG